jgi:NADH-quinone oxidoreductase subunit N
LINSYKINKNLQIVKLILLISYFLLSVIITKKVKIGERDIKIDQLILLDLLVLNAFFLISTQNFIELLLTLEINNVLFIILSTTKNFQLSATEAAFKYFFIGALTTSFYLLGVFILWNVTGQLQFNEIKLFLLHNLEFDSQNLFLILGLVFIFVSFLLKLGFYPCISF